MKGTLSLHPVDPGFFDELIAPLVMGRKLDPEPFIVQAIRMRQNAWRARGTPRAIETILATAGPAKPDPADGLLRKLRVHMEAFDYRPDQVTRLITAKVDPDIHLRGRPFFVAELKAALVAEVVEAYRTAPDDGAVDEIARKQLAALDPALAELVAPEHEMPASGDHAFRSDLVPEITQLSVLAKAARDEMATEPVGVLAGSAAGASREAGAADMGWRARPAPERPADPTESPLAPIPLGTPGGGLLAASRTSARTSAPSALAQLRGTLAWRALSLHARIVPFWTAEDVDGLETVCRAVGVASPVCLLPARRLFAEAIESFPGLGEEFRLEIAGERDIGAFVAPSDIGELLDFLKSQGARIIAAGARHGEGAACTALLRKIKECATYAQRHGLGYLEASGIPPLAAEYEPEPA